MVVMVHVSRERFEHLVGEALDAIPDDLAAQMSNVAVVVEDEPAEGDSDLLGLYTGIPLPERHDYSAVMPDVIEIYMGPICRMCRSEAEVVEEVRITVIHEVAHHFGIDDEQLHQLGWA